MSFVVLVKIRVNGGGTVPHTPLSADELDVVSGILEPVPQPVPVTGLTIH
jgi:hypothetical protein